MLQQINIKEITAKLSELWRGDEPAPIRFEKLGYRLKMPYLASPLYPLVLNRRNPETVNTSATSLWPGSAERGQRLLDGQFEFDNELIQIAEPTWAPAGASRHWKKELHSFVWLRDLRAVGDKEASIAAQKTVSFWISKNRYWWPNSWHPLVTGRRLHHWTSSLDFLSQNAPADFHKEVATSIYIQANHLAQVLPAGLRGARLVTAAKGLVTAGLALPRCPKLWRQGITLIEEALKTDVASDGFHRERCPKSQFIVLRDLIDLRNAFAQAELAEPSFLDEAITKMAPALRFFIQPDGQITHLNAVPSVSPEAVQRLLKWADGGAGPTAQESTELGFQRLSSKNACLFADVGVPAPSGYDRSSHAGTLSFEYSSGKTKLIVNCGSHVEKALWGKPQRVTAAHSTLVVNETNSSEILETKGLGRQPRLVTAIRSETNDTLMLDTSHDGYEELGLGIHHRRLRMAQSGALLEGEDRWESSAEVPAVLRFHLHPEVRASLTTDGTAVLLNPNKGPGWRFQAHGGSLEVTESIHLTGNEHRRTSQIVVHLNPAHQSRLIVWSFSKQS